MTTPDCVSENFAAQTTLAFGRDAVQVVAESLVYSNSDGADNTPRTLINQSLAWTNNTGLAVYAHGVFARPFRQLTADAPVRTYLDEEWAYSASATPPTLTGTAIQSQFGGGDTSGVANRLYHFAQDALSWTPLPGQVLVNPGGSMSWSYQCRCAISGGSAGGFVQVKAQWHRIQIVATPAQAL